MSELERNVREICLRGNIREIRMTLDTILAIMNEPGAMAAGLRASCARLVLELAEEIVEMTG